MIDLSCLINRGQSTITCRNRPLTPTITPSSLPMETLPGLVLPEPLLPHRSTNALDNSRHSIQRTAVSAFLSGILIRGGSAYNEDRRAGNNSFSDADMARHITWAPLPIIRRDETPVESSGERDFTDDTTLVEDSDFDFNDDSGYDPDSENSEFNYSPNDDPEFASEDSEISDFADDETAVEASESQFEYGFLANPPAGGYHSHLGGQLGLNLHVGRVGVPEYTSPYGVNVTVREVPEDELSDAEAEVSRDEANTLPAPPPTEVDSQEQRVPMPSDVDRQLRDHLERDADNVLTYEGPEGQMHFVDEADGDVERVLLRSWNGLRRMGSRMPSPVSSNRTSGIRRRFGAVVDKVKKWFRK